MERTWLTVAIGRTIREQRERCGLTLDELAEGAGVKRTLLWQIEMGNQDCDVYTLSCLAAELGTEPDALIREACEQGSVLPWCADEDAVTGGCLGVASSAE